MVLFLYFFKLMYLLVFFDTGLKITMYTRLALTSHAKELLGTLWVVNELSRSG